MFFFPGILKTGMPKSQPARMKQIPAPFFFSNLAVNLQAWRNSFSKFIIHTRLILKTELKLSNHFFQKLLFGHGSQRKCKSAASHLYCIFPISTMRASDSALVWGGFLSQFSINFNENLNLTPLNI